MLRFPVCVGLLGHQFLLGKLPGEPDTQHRLGVVVGHGGVAATGLGRFLQGFDQFQQDLPVQSAAPPLEEEGLILAQGHLGPLAHVLNFGEGALFRPVEGPGSIGAGGQGIEGG